MKKKKINWKAFKRMYRELGEYRIVEERGKYLLQRYVRDVDHWFDSWWLEDSISPKTPETIESLTKKLLEFRYDKAKSQNKVHKTEKFPKVKYTHP